MYGVVLCFYIVVPEEVSQEAFFFETSIVGVRSTMINNPEGYEHMKQDNFMEIPFEEFNLQGMYFVDVLEKEAQQIYKNVAIDINEPTKKIKMSGISINIPQR